MSIRPRAALASMLAGAALVIIGFGYKISMAPFHMWTPDVYEGSPTPVAAYMSVGTKGAGFAALARVLLVGLGSQYSSWVIILAVLAGVSVAGVAVHRAAGAADKGNLVKVVDSDHIVLEWLEIDGRVAEGTGVGPDRDRTLNRLVWFQNVQDSSLRYSTIRHGGGGAKITLDGGASQSVSVDRLSPGTFRCSWWPGNGVLLWQPATQS